jgi:NAD(P)-dependent dehydrogenase (short-subunit alcohol dehydrogenase family)
MRILIVGGTGTIGAATAEALEARGHEVVRVGHRDGDHTVDLADPVSIDALYAEVGPVDAVVCTAGVAVFGGIEDLEDAAYETSIANKMMGQVNLVRAGLNAVPENGSFTLTTGTLSQRPSAGTVAVAMVGAGVEAFVKAAALDLEGRWRLCAVSPGHVAESRVASGLDPMPGIWARDLAEYYVRCVEGEATGVVFEADQPIA